MGDPIFGFVALFIAIVFTIFYMIKSRHIERMARIEHGLDEELDESSRYGLAYIGVFIIFLGLGIFVGYFLSIATILPTFIALPGSLMVLGGLGLVVAQLIKRLGDS